MVNPVSNFNRRLFVARLDKVLEMVDTSSVQMRHTPFAIFVIIEEESEKRKFDTIVKGLPPLVYYYLH